MNDGKNTHNAYSGVFGGAATALSYNRTYAAGASEKEKPIIAIGQMCSTNDIESNIRLCRRLCIEAKEKGACFLSLPECFEYMGIPGTGDAIRNAQRRSFADFNAAVANKALAPIKHSYTSSRPKWWRFSTPTP